MIEYLSADERDGTPRSFRIQVFRMRIGDGIAVNEDRQKLAEQHAGNDVLLTSLYAYPLLKHSSVYAVGGTPDTAQQTDFTLDEYLKLPEELAEQWYAEVLSVNPQHGLSQLELLKNVISGLSKKNNSSENSQAAEPNDS